jgi:hypothetical protein
MTLYSRPDEVYSTESSMGLVEERWERRVLWADNTEHERRDRCGNESERGMKVRGDTQTPLYIPE